MPAIIEINDAGQALLAIPDADGVVHKYRYRIVPPGFALWAIQLTRVDTEASYHVAEDSPGRWTCTCDAFKYRKRGAPPCKHCISSKALRAFLRDLTEETNHARATTTTTGQAG